MAHAIARRACGALAGFLMTKLGKKNEEGEAQEDQEEQEEQEEDAGKAEDLAAAGRAEIPADPQSMAQLTQNDAASKKAALEQLARKREFLQEQSDGLKYELGLKIDRILQVERVIEERRPEWESWPELHDDLVREADEARRAAEDVNERKRQTDDDMDAVDAAADELDPKGKREMFPD